MDAPVARVAARPGYRPVWYRGKEAPVLPARSAPGAAYRPVFYRTRPVTDAPVDAWPT